MRRELDNFFCNIAKENDKIYILLGDVGFNEFKMFEKLYPDRIINCGLIEESMIGIAAGMALNGLEPWIYAITPFLIERPFEALKIDIDMNCANVKLIGYADYPTQGLTHQELDGRKLMSLFRNIKSYFPKNREETRQCLYEMYKTKKPCFISLKRG